jgi:hypothetical protein
VEEEEDLFGELEEVDNSQQHDPDLHLTRIETLLCTITACPCPTSPETPYALPRSV